MSLARFTVACLITTFIGMLSAIAVAEGSRPAQSWEFGMVVPCIYEQGLTCAPPLRK